MTYQQRSLGAHTSLSQLAAYRLAASRLLLKNNTRAIRQLTGPFHSNKRGRGMEFEDVRLYQPGDDIRSIDWRVTARTGLTHTKQYREEREKPVLIVVDQRQTMFFGSRHAMKSVMAADIAAYIAWSCHSRGDRVGGLVFNDSRHQDVRPGQQRKTVLQLLQCISDFNQALDRHAFSEQQHWLQVLSEIKRISRPGTQVFLISDFHDLDEQCSALLHDLARHCEITAIKVCDPLEEQLPVNGLYQAFNGKDTVRFESTRKNRQRYHDDFVQQHQALQTLLNRFAIPLIPASTEQAPLALLQHYFGVQR